MDPTEPSWAGALMGPLGANWPWIIWRGPHGPHWALMDWALVGPLGTIWP